MRNCEKLYEFWLENASDKFVRESLLSIKNDESAIRDAFYKDLEFGTGGLRGVMGAGTNCMNFYTVAKTTCGVAHYMISQGMSSAAVAFDSRNNSEFFAHLTASVLASNGMTVFVVEGCMPTPFLSFSVRALKCDMGINITASHNPAEYNGYKVYGADGCQITDSACGVITQFIEKIDEFQVETGSFKNFVKIGKIKYVPKEISELFLKNVFEQSLGNANGIKVAYSALNGTGFRFVPDILRKIEVDDVLLLQEQCYPDGNFPTCPKPNPELDETLARVVNFADKNGCDLAIATDPDCDRIGVAARHDGKFVRLTGNEVGVILTDYILNTLSQKNALPQNGVLVKTIVTTALVEKIASDFGVQTINLLTGFKYIGEYIGKLEKQDRLNDYIFGFEESCGYLRGTYVRDKDAVVASMLLAEAAAYHKKRGLTLVGRLNQLYEKYGRYEHRLISYRFEGADGSAKKSALLTQIRKNGLSVLGDSKIVAVKDFSSGIDGLPKSDVLKYSAADGSELVIRPSGTEPLIKTYVTVCRDAEQNVVKIEKIRTQLDEIFS